MAIKSIESPNAIDLVREARAAQTQARASQRPVARRSDAPPTQQAQQAQEGEVQQSPPPADSPSLRFHVDQDTGKTVVSLINPTSGEVLRQVPSSEALEVAKAIGKFQGMFVNLKV